MGCVLGWLSRLRRMASQAYLRPPRLTADCAAPPARSPQHLQRPRVQGPGRARHGRGLRARTGCAQGRRGAARRRHLRCGGACAATARVGRRCQPCPGPAPTLPLACMGAARRPGPHQPRGPRQPDRLAAVPAHPLGVRGMAIRLCQSEAGWMSCSGRLLRMHACVRVAPLPPARPLGTCPPPAPPPPCPQGYAPRFTAEYIERTVGPDAFNVGELFPELRWCGAGAGCMRAGLSDGFSACRLRRMLHALHHHPLLPALPPCPPSTHPRRNNSYLQYEQEDAMHKSGAWLREAKHCSLFDFISKGQLQVRCAAGLAAVAAAASRAAHRLLRRGCRACARAVLAHSLPVCPTPPRRRRPSTASTTGCATGTGARRA